MFVHNLLFQETEFKGKLVDLFTAWESENKFLFMQLTDRNITAMEEWVRSRVVDSNSHNRRKLGFLT